MSESIHNHMNALNIQPITGTASPTAPSTNFAIIPPIKPIALPRKPKHQEQQQNARKSGRTEKKKGIFKIDDCPQDQKTPLNQAYPPNYGH